MSQPNITLLARAQAISSRLVARDLRAPEREELLKEQAGIFEQLGQVPPPPPPVEPIIASGASDDERRAAEAVTAALNADLPAAAPMSLDDLSDAQMASVTEKYLTSKGLITARPKPSQTVYVQLASDFYGCEIRKGFHYCVVQDLPIWMNPSGSKIQEYLANGYSVAMWVTDAKTLAVMEITEDLYRKREKEGWAADARQREIEMTPGSNSDDSFVEVQNRPDRSVVLGYG